MKIIHIISQALTLWCKKLSFPKAQYFFLVVSLTAGLIIIFITPPFQVPDEINHFYRAYQISTGQFISQKHDNRLGGYVPESFVELTKPYLSMRGNKNVKTSLKVIKEQFHLPLNEANKVFADFPNTSLFPPISYLPQSVSILIFRKLNLPVIYIFYGARLFTFLFWVICIYLLLRTMPVFKWLMTLLVLLPMSLFINMSISADVMTNIISFLLIGYLIKHAHDNADFRRKQLLILIIFSVILASAKIVYSPLILLFLIIPVKKFKNLKMYLSYCGAILLAGFGTALLWTRSIDSLYIPYQDYNPMFLDDLALVNCSNLYDQFEYILNNGFYIFRVFANSMVHTFYMYYQGYIGTFGWLDTHLPKWLIHLSYIVIVLVAVLENNQTYIFRIWQRVIILAVSLGTISMVLLSQHLSWDCVGGEIIGTIQGRYFIPAFPLLFIILSNQKVNHHNLAKILAVGFSLLLIIVSIRIIYLRYYV